MDELRGKVAVITGAGSGFGKAFAESGAELGLKLVLADVQDDDCSKVAESLRTRGAEVIACHTDVSDGAEVEALAVRAYEKFGAVHLLFNNAGVGSAGLIWENTEQDWRWTLGVNLWGVIHGLRAFVPRMLAAASESDVYRGHVINTASMAGLLNPPLSGVYNASKHAVVSISETLHHDLGLVTEQVRCSVLCPFYVPTGIHQSKRNRPEALANATAETQSQKAAEAMVAKAVTSGRVTAEQVAEMTFAAIRAKQFYIASHPAALDGVRLRADDITSLRNPTDPLAHKQELRAALIAALRP